MTEQKQEKLVPDDHKCNFPLQN